MKMFTIEAEGYKFQVNLFWHLPNFDVKTPRALARAINRMAKMTKRQFRKHKYVTECYIYNESNSLPIYTGTARLGYADRIVVTKTAGARIAFSRAIANFPRDVRKLFWQQYFEEESKWDLVQ